MKVEGAALIVGVVFLAAVFIYNFIHSRRRIKALKQESSVSSFNKKFRANKQDDEPKEINIMNNNIDFIERDALHSKIQEEIHGSTNEKGINFKGFNF